jgi:hypothetical protein
MTDLSDRILAAIEEVRRNAEELKAVRPTLMRIGLSTSDGRSLVVSSDPSADLRRCEADKRTVERHHRELAFAIVVDKGVEQHGCAHCGKPWPCSDLLDRADAYDVPTEEAP